MRRVNVGVTYAISANQCKKFLGCLKSGRVVDHATLGATVGTGGNGGVIVDDILDYSDAYRRGLRRGDEIVSFGGRDIRTVNAFKNVLSTYPSDWRVPITFRRDGVTRSTVVRLRTLHATNELNRMFNPPAPPRPNAEKKDDEKKDGEKKGEKKDGDKKEEAPPQQQPQGPAPPMPDVVAKHYEKRSGYINYYYNKLNRDRVWNGLVKHGDFNGVPKHWAVEGELAEGGGQVKVDLTEEIGTIVLPDGESKAAFYEELSEQLNPPGSGGLLVALHLWQRFLTAGPDKFGEVYYEGTMPLPSSDSNEGQPMVDVLVGLHGGVQARFYFDPESGNLVGMELDADEEVFPAEIYFSDFQKVDGREVPFRWEVRNGEKTFAVINLKKFSTLATVEK